MSRKGGEGGSYEISKEATSVSDHVVTLGQTSKSEADLHNAHDDGANKLVAHNRHLERFRGERFVVFYRVAWAEVEDELWEPQWLCFVVESNECTVTSSTENEALDCSRKGDLLDRSMPGLKKVQC